MNRSALPRRLAIAGIPLLVLGALVHVAYRKDMNEAWERLAAGSELVATPCGPIEYAIEGTGPPVLVVHGAGGGFDQGLLMAGDLVERGYRAIAVSRFGYLRTPLPDDASAGAQADAHACLLDGLGLDRVAVLGASAGAPSSLQFAILHPERLTALVLLVPATWLPASRGAGTEVPRGLPVIFDTAPAVTTTLERYDLENMQAPTLIISVEDDLYGTFERARYTAGQIADARFIGFPDGGHLLVGRQDEVAAAIDNLLQAAFASEETDE